MGTYIRRLYPDELEIVNDYGETFVYNKYGINLYDKSIVGLDYGIEIHNINEFISSGDWIKIGELKK